MSFLATENPQFKQNFILYDLTLCSSEILPLNLGVPTKKKTNVKNQQSISSSRRTAQPANQRIKNQSEQEENAETQIKKKQSIRQSIRQSIKATPNKEQEKDGKNADNKAFPSDILTKPKDFGESQLDAKEPEFKPQQMGSDNDNTDIKKKRDSQVKQKNAEKEPTNLKLTRSLRQSRKLSIRGSQATISTTRTNILADMKRMLNGYYFIPLIESQVATMIVSIEFSGKSCGFSLHPPASIQDKIVVTAKCENDKAVDIFFEHEKIIDMKYNGTTDSFNAVVLGLNIDICSTQFRDKETTVVLPGFDNVQSRQKIAFVSFEPMVPLATAAEKSGKTPFVFDLTYNYPNPLSFDVLQNGKPPTCTFKCELINNSLKCTYPFAPIQAFIALLGSFLNPHRGLLHTYQNMFE